MKKKGYGRIVEILAGICIILGCGYVVFKFYTQEKNSEKFVTEYEESVVDSSSKDEEEFPVIFPEQEVADTYQRDSEGKLLFEPKLQETEEEAAKSKKDMQEHLNEVEGTVDYEIPEEPYPIELQGVTEEVADIFDEQGIEKFLSVLRGYLDLHGKSKAEKVVLQEEWNNIENTPILEYHFTIDEDEKVYGLIYDVQCGAFKIVE